jgi:hypothetical protein
LSYEYRATSIEPRVTPLQCAKPHPSSPLRQTGAPHPSRAQTSPKRQRGRHPEFRPSRAPRLSASSLKSQILNLKSETPPPSQAQCPTSRVRFSKKSPKMPIAPTRARHSTCQRAPELFSPYVTFAFPLPALVPNATCRLAHGAQRSGLATDHPEPPCPRDLLVTLAPLTPLFHFACKVALSPGNQSKSLPRSGARIAKT